MNEIKLSPKERAAKFIAALRSACQDRGKRAALRRGLSPATVMDSWPVIARLGGDVGQPGESAFIDIAAFFASHPQESGDQSFGETCRRIAQGDGKEIAESFERRFRRLLASEDTGDLTGQIRTWVRLAASKGVGVNYESLFADRWNWKWYADDIRVKWARAFWQSGEPTPKNSPANLPPKTP